MATRSPPATFLFKLSRSGSEEATSLLACRSRRGESQKLLNVLANGHRTQDVQEDEGTLGVVVPGQVAMTQALDPGDGSER